MNEDYILKTGEKHSITLNAGINNEKIGLKLISVGSQLFASNSNFYFYSDNQADKVFHIKTENNDAGILFENGDRNRIYLNGNKGAIFDFHKLNLQVSNPSNFYFNELLTKEYRNGVRNIISGGNVNWDFKEDKLDFTINMFNGNILFNQFKKFISRGEEIILNSGRNVLEINKSKISIDSKSLEFIIEDKGLSIDENFVMTSNNDLRIISKDGNLELLNKNGERISIHNSRPNGTIELISNKQLQKIVNANIYCKNYHIDFIDNFIINSINDSNFSINTGNITFQSQEYCNNSIEVSHKNNRHEIECNKFILNDNIVIDDKLKIKHSNITIEGDNIELKTDKVIFKYNNNVFSLENHRFNYELENNILRVDKDEIKLISDGNMGITLGANRGGVRINGSIDWINEGSRLMESESNSLKIGSIAWDFYMIGNTIRQNSEQIERKSVEFLETINNGVNWKFRENTLQFDNKLLLKSNNVFLEINEYLKLENEISNIYLEKDVVIIQSQNHLIKTEESCIKLDDSTLTIFNKNNNIKLDDKVNIAGERVELISGNGRIEIASNIVLETQGGNEIYNIYLNADRNVSIEAAGLDIDVNNFYGKFMNYYGIVKTDFELVLSGDNFIKNINNEFVVGGSNLQFGCIKIKDNVEIDSDVHIKDNLKMDKFEVNGDGIIMRIDEQFIRLLKNNGIEMCTNYDVQIIGNNSINCYSKNRIFLGNDIHHIKISKNQMEINGGLSCNGNSVSLGWSNYLLSNNDKMVYLGGEKGSLLLTENVSVFECKNIKIKAKDNVDFFSKQGEFSFENFKLDVKNLWIGNNSKILLNDNLIEIKSKKLKFEGNTVLEIGENFLIERMGTFKINEKGINIISKNVDWNFNLDIKGEIAIVPSKNLRLESTIGDIIINSQSCGILLDGIGRVLKIHSEGDISHKSYGKYSINSKDFRLDASKINIQSKDGISLLSDLDLRLDVEKDILINGKEKMDIMLNSFETNTKKDIILRSEIFGGISINKDGLDIESHSNIELIGQNPLGKFKIDFVGKGEIIFSDLEWDIKNKMAVLVEESFILGTRGNITIGGKENIRIEGGDINIAFGEENVSGKKMKCLVKEVEYDVINYKMKQSGFGEYRIETDGKMSFINKFDGHNARAIELNIEGNSHDESLYIGSKMGGIVIDAQKIKIDGVLQLDKIKTNRLFIDGDIEAKSLRLSNLFLSDKGVSFITKEIYEMRNMDIRLDGNIEVMSMKCDRIETKRKTMEIVGDIRVSKIDTWGIKITGGSIGDCGERCRDFLNIKMGDEYIWNTGIRIDSNNKIGIEIESSGTAIKTNGKIESNGVEILNNFDGETEELEELDYDKILEELIVEKGLDGKLRLLKKGKIDIMDLLIKTIALLRKK